jgi:hypothetical protein
MKHHDLPGIRCRGARRSRLQQAGLGAVALAAAIALAACSSGPGGPGGPGGTGSGGGSPSTSAKTSGLAYSQCMRSHGITNFPDPGSNGGISISGGPGVINTNSSQYLAAEQACKSLLPSLGTPAQQEQDYTAELKYAACMRTHGEPNFPDPHAPSNGAPDSQTQSGQGGNSGTNGSNGVNPTSPQYIAAGKACQHYLPAGQGPSQLSTNSGSGS